MSQPAVIDNSILANWTRTLRRSPLQDMLTELSSSPDLTSFALGLPATELFPAQDLSQSAMDLLAAERGALQYSAPQQSLKTHIVKLMAERGVTCRAEEVFLTSGAQQGLSLLARLLLEPGGQLICEDLTYTGFQQVIEPYYPDVLTVSTSMEDGMDAGDVNQLLKAGARPAFIYAMSDGHNPLGVSMSASTRRRLVELAADYGVPIIEDDAYGFLHYEEQSLPCLRSLNEQWVFYVGSFSKILAPALRVGWLIVPEVLQEKLSIIKEAADINSQTFAQRVIERFLAKGRLAAHLVLLRAEYRARRDLMLNSLRNHLTGLARWQTPSSGFFVWLELTEDINAAGLLKIALETERIAYIPGQAFTVKDNAKAAHCVRLSFSNCPTQLIDEGIRRLNRVLCA